MTTPTSPLPDLQICLPSSWVRRRRLDHGVLVAAQAPVLPASGVRPDVVLRVGPAGPDLRRWREEALAELDQRLVDFDLEDADEYDLLGVPTSYRRFAYRSPTGVDLLCDQWAWLLPGASGPTGLGATLTATVAREDYPDYYDVFEAVAETVELIETAA